MQLKHELILWWFTVTLHVNSFFYLADLVSDYLNFLLNK